MIANQRNFTWRRKSRASLVLILRSRAAEGRGRRMPEHVGVRKTADVGTMRWRRAATCATRAVKLHHPVRLPCSVTTLLHLSRRVCFQFCILSLLRFSASNELLQFSSVMRNANVEDEMEALLSSDEFHVSDSDVLSNIDSNDQCDLELSDVEVNNPGGEGGTRKICESNMLEFELPSNQSESITFQASMVFADVHAFRESLVEYSIREGCKLDMVKNEKARITLRCASRDCKWRMHASPMADGTKHFLFFLHFVYFH
ncbi:hypothetical protein KSP40_PGU014368 [Platanthera guangdongensis]|uniref:Transposase MuDR plant domain-containing protein n=1 Tax=Platanthera guangdongensis TaxID=2320717 RepID=A0ABR2MLB9_9ASPA